MPELVSTPRVPVPEALRKEVAELLLTRWWVRALLATEEDRLGVILRTCLMKQLRELTPGVAVAGAAAILNDGPDGGIIRTNWWDGRRMHFAAVICSLDDLLGNCRRLCDQLQFTQLEAEALFGALREWIKDFRTTGETAEDRVPIEYRKQEG